MYTNLSTYRKSYIIHNRWQRRKLKHKMTQKNTSVKTKAQTNIKIKTTNTIKMNVDGVGERLEDEWIAMEKKPRQKHFL